MSEWDYSWDYGGEQPYDTWSWDAGAMPGGFTPDYSYDYGDSQQPYDNWSDAGGAGGESGGGWLSSVLGGLGQVGSFLGKNAGTIGSLLSGAGSIAGGAIGSNASSDAARLQADALNRGMDLQTAQWLQQQENQAPWLQAGREALPMLQRLASRAPQGAFEAPNTPIWGQHAGYAPPPPAPGWQPQDYAGPATPDADGYRWTPGQGPRAADYRYTPGQVPSADDYRYTPGAVPTLEGAELLAADPGVAFRLEEGRKALEASAAARGGLLSGGTLAALQRQGQELSSQEYGAAFSRASQQAQMREGWAQQASSQGYAQAMGETELRERIAQVAQQQGWSQAQAEAAFREGMAQQSSQQGFSQALAGQGQQFTQGLQTQQWNQGQRQQYETELYNRMLQQSQERYGRDVSENQQTYDRSLQAWNSRNAQDTTDWNRWAALAGYGPQAAQQLATGGQAGQTQLNALLSRLGVAQGEGAAGQGLAWMRALRGVTNQVPGILASLNA